MKLSFTDKLSEAPQLCEIPKIEKPGQTLSGHLLEGVHLCMYEQRLIS